MLSFLIDVDTEERTPTKVVSIIVYSIAGFLMGAGYAPYWCLGLVYVDDNVGSAHEATKYLGKKSNSISGFL